MKKLSLIVLAIIASTLSFAQKKPLDHSVYDSWKSVGRMTIPDNGQWGYYLVTPQQGDAVLYIRNMKSGIQFSVERGSMVRISEDGSTAVVKVSPKYEETRQAKIKKKKPDQMPKDTLAIVNLSSGDVHKFHAVKGIKCSERLNGFVAFKDDGSPAPKEGDSSKKDVASRKKGLKDSISKAKPAKEPSTKGNLYVMNIKDFTVDTLKGVDTYQFADEVEQLYFVTKPEKGDSTLIRGFYTYNPSLRSTTAILTGERESIFGSFYFNEKCDKLAFYANLDTTKEARKFTDIYLYDGTQARKLVSRDAEGIPQGWKLASNRSISFYQGDSFITFGTCPIPREKDTTLVDFEQPRLDVWVWNEDYIQPIQKVNLQEELNRTYIAKADLNGNGSIIRLADEEIPSVSFRDENTQSHILAATDKPYRMQQQWDRNPCIDIYRISLKDGSRELVEKGAPYSRPTPSPDGRYYTYYDSAERNWYIYDVVSGERRDMTSRLGVNFYDEDNDTPSVPGPCSRAVWSEKSDFVVIGDRFDLWQFDPAGVRTPVNITEGEGRRTNTTYTYVNPYDDRKFSPAVRGSIIPIGKRVYLTTFNHTTKEWGYAYRDIFAKRSKLTKLYSGPYTFGSLAISESKKDKILTFTRESFEDGRNLWMSADNFKSQSQLTDVNPQQRDYNWGTVELVNWMTEDGIRAEGLLYKPEDFDASKKYPVIIYFYEKYSDELYGSRVPAPSASTVNIPFFVSNGYICFIPDIYYTDGHPGKSCMKSLMPACDMLCTYPWIDGDNMAIQGQSWGGYQVAYLITQTKRFKAAGAGAPVSNMTSAYGGIRWDSGLARTFQYEQQQSRIGDDLWHGFDLYVENSPLFFVPNVTTPVLIMHNDADGAVPWWQGIEFFNGLRRCGKQAWLLQYNDEAHNLKERRNRKDLSIRLAQFFDHFLKGAPMPVWMSKGVPATLKGIDLGYELENNDK